MSVAHAVVGAFAALAAGPGVMFLGMFLAEAVSTGEYAALGGLIYGAIVGGVLTLVALAVGTVQSRSGNGRRRGLGIGLLIGSGLSLLAAGACFGILT